LERNSDAKILEARGRADRPSLEGSESRNRLSGDTHAAGFSIFCGLTTAPKVEGLRQRQELTPT